MNDDDLRDAAIHEAENWLMAFGALIPSSEIHNLSIKLAADLAKPAIETVVQQAEQIAAVLALADHWDRYAKDGASPDAARFATHAASIRRALGVTA